VFDMTTERYAKTVGIAVASLAIGGGAVAQDFDMSIEVGVYSEAATTDATDLVPDPDGAGYRSQTTGASAVVNAQYDHGAFRLGTQLRIELTDTDSTATIDEAYGEVSVAGGQGFVFAGRRIFSYGQAYGLNPVDIFADPLRENDVYGSTKARNDIQGVDMVGTEWLFNNGGALTAIYAPDFDKYDDDQSEDLGVLRYSGAAGRLDYAVSAMSGDRPGVGVSATYGLGDASVLYVDGTLRRGREKETVTGVVADQLIVDAADGDEIVPFVTVGVGHTFGNGVSLNAEYTHDGGGYSDDEWADIDGALADLTPVTSALAGQSFAQLNGVLNHYALRQNYGFVRLAQDGIGGSKFNAEFTVLHGFDDQSGAAGLRVERALGDSATAGVALSQKYGDENSEFKLRPGARSVAIYTTVRF
jgi:hypothetical protein